MPCPYAASPTLPHPQRRRARRPAAAAPGTDAAALAALPAAKRQRLEDAQQAELKR